MVTLAVARWCWSRYGFDSAPRRWPRRRLILERGETARILAELGRGVATNQRRHVRGPPSTGHHPPDEVDPEGQVVRAGDCRPVI